MKPPGEVTGLTVKVTLAVVSGLPDSGVTGVGVGKASASITNSEVGDQAEAPVGAPLLSTAWTRQ